MDYEFCIKYLPSQNVLQINRYTNKKEIYIFGILVEILKILQIRVSLSCIPRFSAALPTRGMIQTPCDAVEWSPILTAV